MVKMDFAKVAGAGGFYSRLHGTQGRCVLSKSKAKTETPKTLADDLVARLEGAIFRGEFPPGTRIPEARTPSDLGSGPGPLRPAACRQEDRKSAVPHATPRPLIQP